MDSINRPENVAKQHFWINYSVNNSLQRPQFPFKAIAHVGHVAASGFVAK